MALSVSDLVGVLRSIPADQFNPAIVKEALTGVELSSASLEKYVHFDDRAYTRNQIYRDDTFEVLALCWDPATTSPIHNHSGQDCWMYIHHGGLCLEDFQLEDASLRGQVGEGIKVIRSGRTPRADVGEVDHRGANNEIHRVINCRSFKSRAISIHVYSQPFDQCIVYETRRKLAYRKELEYHTVDGLRV